MPSILASFRSLQIFPPAPVTLVGCDCGSRNTSLGKVHAHGEGENAQIAIRGGRTPMARITQYQYTETSRENGKNEGLPLPPGQRSAAARDARYERVISRARACVGPWARVSSSDGLVHAVAGHRHLSAHGKEERRKNEADLANP